MRSISTTANWVAFYRGLASLDPQPLISDPLARLLVRPVYRRLLDWARSFGFARRSIQRGVGMLTPGRVDHMRLRTRAIDDAVRAGVAGGIDQLVILGAGLDARAHRMPELRQVQVFELDHPLTQEYKRERLGAEARPVTFVPIDFERQAIDRALAEVGRTPARALFVCEGVTPYLRPETVDGMLASVAACAAGGSVVLVTYCEPFVRGAHQGRMRFLTRAAGEPFRCFLPRAEIAALLQRQGFTVEDDAGDPEWSVRYDRPASASVERLAIARRAG